MKFKKIFSAILSMLIVFSMSVTAFASTSSKTVDEQLTEMGFPEYVIGTMNNSAKERALVYDGRFDSATVQYFDENMNLINQLDFEEGNETILPRGTISSSTLSLNLMIMNLDDGSKVLILAYDWQRLPLNRWRDQLGLQWDSSRWYPVENTFYQISSYNVNTGGHLIENVTANESNYPMNSCPSGVIWDANLRGSSTDYSVYALYGTGSVMLRPYAGGGTVHGGYMHTKLNLGASIGFGSLNLSFNGPSLGFDQMSIFKNL